MKKEYMYWVLGLVVVAIIVVGVYANTHQKSPEQSSTQGNSNDNAALEATSTQPDSGTTSGKLSYGDAIKKYTERFQFVQCLGTPNSIAVKKGSPVMLDNRDTVAHTFKADTQTFRIAGYDYAILYPQVLGNLAVTCDGKPRVTLNVQK